MRDGARSVAVRDLHTLFSEGVTGMLSDGELLGRFVARREEAVFETIIRRHGPVVWGVCRRVLGDHHDAEDAFQASFLVLARRAASMREPEKLGNWLYGVAHQTAMKARAARAKRQAREGQVPDVPEPTVVTDDPRDELAESLDRELARLPEKFRLPVVLCDLEGRTHREAASQLGWPVGTVSSRLSRARATLARRLSRPGRTLSGVSLAFFLVQESATAGVPTRLIGSAARAGSLFAAGRAATAGAFSAEAVALAGEEMKAMLMSKIKMATAMLVAVSALVGVGAWQASTRADERALPDDAFRLTVNEVIADGRTLVTRVEIETPPGSMVEVIPDKADRGGGSVRAPDRAAGPSRTQVIIFADHVEWKAGSTNALKFMMQFKGSGVGTMCSEGPMREGKKLGDVVRVAIRPGEYKYGVSTKLVTFEDVTYSLVVKKSK